MTYQIQRTAMETSAICGYFKKHFLTSTVYMWKLSARSNKVLFNKLCLNVPTIEEIEFYWDYLSEPILHINCVKCRPNLFLYLVKCRGLALLDVSLKSDSSNILSIFTRIVGSSTSVTHPNHLMSIFFKFLCHWYSNKWQFEHNNPPDCGTNQII